MLSRRFLEIFVPLAIGAIVIGVAEFFVDPSTSVAGQLFLSFIWLAYAIVVFRVGQRHNEEKRKEVERRNQNLWG